MNDKHEDMLAFWSDRVKQYGADPRANTNDIWLRELEIQCVNKIIKQYSPGRILDFGCANGYTTTRLAKDNPQCSFLGIDINSDMIAAATKRAQQEGHGNLSFRKLDILQDETEQRYDFIYAIRVFQNIESAEMQRRIFDGLCALLQPNGLLYFIESYADGYAQLNADRVQMTLPPLPIHPHLTLLTDEFDKYAAERMDLLERTSPSSSYYLVTRLLYSFIAQMNNEPIDYNHPIHQTAVLLPQIGEYGPQRAFLYRKRESGS